MDHDISRTLTFQVKRELAERYFGTRKLIEEELERLRGMIEALELMYVQKIGRDLVRIYALLKERDLIEEFMKAAGWNDVPFYDEYVIDSDTIRQRLMDSMLVIGWFSKTKFTNMLVDSYDRLYHDCSRYQDLYDEAMEEYAIVMEEVRQFRARYSLDEIMSFVGQLDGEGDGPAIMGVVDSGGRQRLAGQMELSVPADMMDDVHKIPSLPSPDSIRNRLESLASRAEPGHREEVLHSMSESS